MSWKTDEGSTVSPGQYPCTKVCGCNGCCAWLWLWTGWLLSILSWFSTIWLCSVPQQWKNTWLGSSIRPMMRSYLQLKAFLRIRMRASIPQESKCCKTDGSSVWTAAETMLKNLGNLPTSHCHQLILLTEVIHESTKIGKAHLPLNFDISMMDFRGEPCTITAYWTRFLSNSTGHPLLNRM